MLTISSSWNTRIDFDTFSYHLYGVMSYNLWLIVSHHKLLLYMYVTDIKRDIKWGASSRCSSPNDHRKDSLHFTTFFIEQIIHGLLFRSKSVFILGNAETIIDFECVPTYSQAFLLKLLIWMAMLLSSNNIWKA